MTLRWDHSFVARSLDVDFRKRASVETICRWFMEAAWTHAEHLGFGYSQLAQTGRLWVLSRLLVEIDAYPSWGEHVTVLTWPRSEKSVFAMREFQLLDGSQCVVARGTSAWLVLDAATRRPVRSDKVLSSVEGMLTDRATSATPEKIGEISEPEVGKPFDVRYSDIDVNAHVNSCTYLRWILDSYPLQFHAANTVAKLEVSYLDETREGEMVQLLSNAKVSPHRHAVRKAGAGDVCRVLLHWSEDDRGS